MSEQLDLFEQPPPEVVTVLTVNQAVRIFVRLYWKRKKMYKGSLQYLNDIVSFLNGRLLHTITRQDIRNLRAYVAARGVGISGQNKPHMIFTLMVNKLEEWREDGWAGGHDISGLHLPRHNPGLLVKRAKEKPHLRFITPLEYRAYFKIARELGYHDMAAAIRFGIWAHLSPIDLFALNEDEVDESAWQIHVYRRHTRTDQNPLGSLQVIELTEKMWGALQGQRKYRSPDEKRFFVITNRRRKLATIRKVARERGYPDFTWAHLRKAGSGYLHNEGVGRTIRAHILGHKDERVTDRHYTPPGNPKAREAQIMVQEAFS